MVLYAVYQKMIMKKKVSLLALAIALLALASCICSL